MPATVDSKRLAQTLSLLDATLTQNPEVEVASQRTMREPKRNLV